MKQAYIFDGKKFAKEKEEELKNKISHLGGVIPKLVVVLVGDNEASKIYVNLKKSAAERIGIDFQLIEFHSATKEMLLHLIEELNNDHSAHGIMIQLPLPEELASDKDGVLKTIKPSKDVDGLNESSSYLPATAKAILHSVKAAQSMGYLDRHWEDITVCVVGATGMVGKPLVRDLKQKGAKVLECDVNTRNLAEHTIQAGLLISATGVPIIIKEDMVKRGAVVIDVGAPKGDVDFEKVSKIASFITPVPGGIGPVTVVSLLENTALAASKK